MDYEQIKSAISISEVLNHHGIPTPARRTFRLACPIHHGDGPNFSVDSSKNVFHCFTCGASGSVIDLFAQLEGISIVDAAQKLSEDHNLEYDSMSVMANKLRGQMDKFQKSKHEMKDELLLPEGHALEVGYRGLDQETIDHFHLIRTEDGVCIPHFGVNGNVIGWATRKPEGSDPKYINTVGSVRGVPFGLFQNRTEILYEGYIVLVEGQFDCIKLWQNGVKNSVALMGSSMTDTQAYLLLAITTNLKLMLDGDEAGRRGAQAISEKWAGVFNLEVVDLPEGIDPAEYVELKEEIV